MQAPNGSAAATTNRSREKCISIAPNFKIELFETFGKIAP
jgi:hypothetical protein